MTPTTFKSANCIETIFLGFIRKKTLVETLNFFTNWEKHVMQTYLILGSLARNSTTITTLLQKDHSFVFVQERVE